MSVRGRILLCIGALAVLTACSKTDADALSLLSSGSPEVCSNSAVRDVLKRYFVPERKEIYEAAEDSSIDKAELDRIIDSFSVDFSMTTPTATDAKVPSVSCSSTVIIKRGSEQTEKFDVTYDVKRSLDKKEGFFLASTAGDFKDRVFTVFMAPVRLRLSEIQKAREEKEVANALLAGKGKAIPDQFLGEWCGDRDGRNFKRTIAPKRIEDDDLSFEISSVIADGDQVGLVGTADNGEGGFDHQESLILQSDMLTVQSDGSNAYYYHCKPAA